MRSAICLFGNVGGTKDSFQAGEPCDFEDCFRTIKKHIISPNSADVFIHSWSVEFERELRRLYKPKRALFERQKLFACPYVTGHHRLQRPERIRRITDVEQRNTLMRDFAARSRWYSNQQVLLLKSEYERRNRFFYDWVMVLRFDIVFNHDLYFGGLARNRFYASHKTSEGLYDLWYLGSSKYMDRFADLYNHYDDYARRYKTTSPLRHSLEHVKIVVGMSKVQYLKYMRLYCSLYRRTIRTKKK
jgi:hypothetical protein